VSRYALLVVHARKEGCTGPECDLQSRCNVGKTETTEQLEVAVREANERLAAFHSLERQSVRSALIEERGRLCLFVCGLKPVMVST